MEIFNAILSIVLSVVALLFSVFTYLRSYKQQKIENTIQAYIELQETLGIFFSYRNGEIEFVDDRDSDEYKILSAALGRLEIFAVCIDKDVYDFEIFYHMAHGYVDYTLRKEIDYMLDIKTPSKVDDPYLELKKLLNKMDDYSIKNNQRN